MVIYLLLEFVLTPIKDGNAKPMRPGAIFGVHMCVKLVNELVSHTRTLVEHRLHGIEITQTF